MEGTSQDISLALSGFRRSIPTEDPATKTAGAWLYTLLTAFAVARALARSRARAIWVCSMLISASKAVYMGPRSFGFGMYRYKVQGKQLLRGKRRGEATKSWGLGVEVYTVYLGVEVGEN